MMSFALPVAPVQPAANGATALQPGQTLQFAALVQQAAGTNPAPILLAPVATGQDGIAQNSEVSSDSFDVTTAEGLMALLTQTIAVLQSTGEDVKPKEVLAAFAAALGETASAGFGDLDAVSQLSDPELAIDLQNIVSQALPVPTTVTQLSVAFAGVPAVAREMAVAPSVAKPSQSVAAGVTRGETTQQPETSENVQALAATKSSEGSGAEGLKGPQPEPAAALPRIVAVNTAGTVPDSLPRDVAVTALPQVQVPQDMHRIAPTPMAAPHHAPSPDDQLRQHVGQQIRTADLGDAKFRFSLSPYGMGDIEIEVVRTEAGRVQIAMTADSPSVLHVLRHDKDQLLDALQSRGISMDTADLDFQTFDDRGRQSQQRTPAPMRTNLSIEQDVDAASAPAARVAGGSGLLDILT